MSSSLRAFSLAASRFPGDLSTLARLAKLLRPSDATRQYTLQLVQAKVRAASPTRLARILELLSSEGVLSRKIRVNSSGGGGIGVFDSLLEVPDRLYDPFRDVEQDVSPEHVEVVFEIPPESERS